MEPISASIIALRQHGSFWRNVAAVTNRWQTLCLIRPAGNLNLRTPSSYAIASPLHGPSFSSCYILFIFKRLLNLFVIFFLFGNKRLLVAYYYRIFASKSNWILRKQLSQSFDLWDKVVAQTENSNLGISKFYLSLKPAWLELNCFRFLADFRILYLSKTLATLLLLDKFFFHCRWKWSFEVKDSNQ